MAASQEDKANNDFVCPIDELGEDLQEQVDELVEHLDGHDSQPLKRMVEVQIAEYLQNLDEIVKDCANTEQLRKSWSQKKMVAVMQDYIAMKEAAVALGLSVVLT